MLTDLRHALRALGRARGFALATALTLALGLGATTALFTAVRGILLRPLPYPDPEQLVELREVSPKGSRLAVTEPNFGDFQREVRAFRATARYVAGQSTVTGGIEAVRVGTGVVSGDFFAVLGVTPAFGRTFAAEERQPGAAATVVVGDAFWRRTLGASRDLERLALTIDGTPHRVVGVMPPGFGFPDDAELWTAAERETPNRSRTAHNWKVVARLRDGVALPVAQAQATALARALRQRHGSDVTLVDATLTPLADEMVGATRPVLVLLLAGAAVLLLVATANVGTMLLARGEARRRELGVRVALGASRVRLVRQFLAEVLVVTAAGSALGVLVALAGARLLVALAPSAVPRLDAVRVDGLVLAFALALALAVALLLGLGAGLRATRVEGATLAGTERVPTATQAGTRARNVLVGAQVALTAVLLVGAGLLARSFAELTAVDPGFRTEGAVVVRLAFPPADDSATDARVRALQTVTLERLRALPGVRHAGSADDLPLGGFYASGTFVHQARPDEIRSFEDFGRLVKDPTRAGQAAFRRASDGYFEAIGIPLVRGRLFDGRDTPGAPPVAVISASLARTAFGDRDPLGQLVQFGNMDGDLRPLTIVGVVGDVREAGPAAPPQPTLYANARQRPTSTRFAVVIAGAPPGTPGERPLDAAAMVGLVRRTAQGIDPAVPVVRVEPLEERYASALAARRGGLLLAGAFAASALLLAVAGLAGVVSYLVAQRRRELGVRVALGARSLDVRRLVLGRGLRPAVAGVVVGLVVALAAARVLAAQLYAVRPADPLTFALVAAALLAVAVLAAWGPARRAARVDPMTALRAD
jgi:predicted permease